jgi:hypothetical protein
MLWRPRVATVHRKAASFDQAACKPGSVHRPCERIGNHSSGTILTDRLTRPTRTERYGAPVELLPKDWLDARPYSVLLQAGLALPSLFPVTRCALTAPFHPCLSGEPERRFAFCGAIPRVGRPLRNVFPGRTLSAALPSWSPDFPPAHHSFERMACQRSPGRLIESSSYQITKDWAIQPVFEPTWPIRSIKLRLVMACSLRTH